MSKLYIPISDEAKYYLLSRQNSIVCEQKLVTLVAVFKHNVKMAGVLTNEKRAAIVRALVEGSSIRATSRMIGVSRNTVIKLMTDLSGACVELHELKLRNLPCKRVQCDEIWSFVGKKAKHVTGEEDKWVGDVWTYTAICAGTKLCASWLVGARDGFNAELFMRDLESRLAERVQLTTDDHTMYLEAVDKAFGPDGVDYTMLQKQYGDDSQPQKRYSPAKCTGAKKVEIRGNPDPKHIKTSYAEAPEPNDAHEHASLHSADERLHKEGREPRGRSGHSLRLLQLLSSSPVATH